jgi:hypothetical protein
MLGVLLRQKGFQPYQLRGALILPALHTGPTL